jgi:MFS family permease
MPQNGLGATVVSEPMVRSKQPSSAWFALTLLIIINLFNYIDRSVLAAVLPNVEKAFLADDQNAGFWLGLLTTAFMVSYMLLSPVFGWLGERMSRWWLIGIGVVLWSLASGGSGLAQAYGILLLTRCFVGVGEAAYGPVAPTVIADLYPVESRGRMLSRFYAAIPVGSALGYALGGQVAGPPDLPDAWRWAFLLVVPPGILLGLVSFFMREPGRGLADVGATSSPRKPQWSDYRGLLHIRSYVLNTLGMTAMTFAFGAFAVWMPTYLVERGAPPIGPIDARTFFGMVTVLAGLLATLSGGWTGDKLRSRYPGSYFLVSGFTMLIGFPMVLLVLWTPFPWNWAVIFLTVFCLFFNTGPTNTILANVTHPAVRARAFGLNILIIHLFGDVISPSLIGTVRDVTGGLAAGFVLVAFFILIGGLLWLWGARYLEEDTQLAPTRLNGTMG